MSNRRRALEALANDPRTPLHERETARLRLEELLARRPRAERRKGVPVLAVEALRFVPADFIPHGSRHPYQAPGSVTIPRKLGGRSRP